MNIICKTVHTRAKEINKKRTEDKPTNVKYN